MSKNYCDSCKVNVSEGLRFCPLCGKFVGENEKIEAKVTKHSFPSVDMSYIYIVKWVKIVKSVFVLIAILSVLINLFFKTKVFWFPYVLVGLLAIWRMFFYPFKEGKNHLASLSKTGIIISIILIFIDVYNYYSFGLRLGWALCYATPATLTFTCVLSFILAIIKRNYEEELARGILTVVLVGLMFLLCKIIWFNNFASWPIFMCLVSAFTLLFLLFLIKRKKLVKELNRNFHL